MKTKLFIILVLCSSFAIPLGSPNGDDKRESVLDRKVHIEEGIIFDIPQLPPLCDDLDIEKRRINVGDCKLYCELEGEGTPLVLINGGPGGTHHYFHPQFSRAGEFAQVVYYDQRGCGISDYIRGKGYTVAQAAADLDNLREALGFEKWILLGHSYGGFLAQYYALHYPDRTAGLVLVCASTGMNVSLGNRQYNFISEKEQKRIDEIGNDGRLDSAQRVFNRHLNGDWKRQSFYKPTREELARGALYGWVHDSGFNAIVNKDIRRQEDMTGLFDSCPIPTLILESKWDLTWGEQKPKTFHKNHPGSKMVVFKQSGHSPFKDEPALFFKELEKFLKKLPKVKERILAKWKKHLEDRKSTLHYLVNSLGWGRKSNEKIAEKYKKDWLDETRDTGVLLKIGFALYDVKRYKEALQVFEKMEKRAGGDKINQVVSLIWQGHMLDLLKRRKDAVSVYRKAAYMNIRSSMRHDQFGIRYVPSEYAKERMETPFTRVENRQED